MLLMLILKVEFGMGVIVLGKVKDLLWKLLVVRFMWVIRLLELVIRVMFGSLGIVFKLFNKVFVFVLLVIFLILKFFLYFVL